MASGFKSVNNSPVKIPKALSIAITQALTEKMESIFKEIEDPRIERNRVHLLTDILITRWRTRSKRSRSEYRRMSEKHTLG